MVQLRNGTFQNGMSQHSKIQNVMFHGQVCCTAMYQHLSKTASTYLYLFYKTMLEDSFSKAALFLTTAR
jgi:hypothetical protein